MKRLIVLGIFAVSAALAQPPGPPPGRMGFGGRGPMGGEFMRPVTGAPYSATEVSSSQQVLANGNVIQRQSQTNFYRDGQGRTRSEMTMKHADGTTTSHVTIHDPVAGVSHDLNPQSKVSRDMNFHAPPAGANRQGGPRGGGPGANRAMVQRRTSDPNVTTENLGTQTINGVSATGTRITRTIPAGAEGNSMAIQIVHETWMSDDLKVPVMIKHTDPRSGTSTTQLTNILRAEPDASLFTVPAGYTVQKGQGPGRGPGHGPRGGGNGQ
ncbi:MAG: hypothetical protein WBY44_22610 [Bryobacteraceae bacterium]